MSVVFVCLFVPRMCWLVLDRGRTRVKAAVVRLLHQRITELCIVWRDKERLPVSADILRPEYSDFRIHRYL
jgi:hypothetical protein